MRGITDIQQVSVDAAQKSLVLRGSAGQVAPAEWLFYELDKPADRPALPLESQSPTTHEYRLPGGVDDVLRVFYLTHTGTPRELQEVATAVRSTADIRRLFTCNPSRAHCCPVIAFEIPVNRQMV